MIEVSGADGDCDGRIVGSNWRRCGSRIDDNVMIEIMCTCQWTESMAEQKISASEMPRMLPKTEVYNWNSTRAA